MEKLLKTINLKKNFMVKDKYGMVKIINALRGVSFEINKGETLGIIGESGSGKTTLGKTVIRLIEPDEGRIIFKDIDITHKKENQLRPLRKKFQIIFQNPYKSLNPRMTALEIVMEATDGSKKEKIEKGEYFLNIVGIKKNKFRSFPYQFSGGERQRIAIARSLSTEPEFIVCDEPTSNLDLSIQAQILNLFMDLKEKFNLTYLFISHDLKVIKFVSDRIGVMYKGKIVEIGKTEEIIKNPENPYVRELFEIEKKQFSI